MMPGAPSEDLFRFLETHIDSVYQLELLLYLRTNPDRDWAVQAVADQLQLRPESVHAALDQLCRSGLLQQDQDSRYRLSTENEELLRMVDQVAQAYSDYRVRIINFIHSGERLRTRDPIQAFAAAFRLGRASQRDTDGDEGE